MSARRESGIRRIPRWTPAFSRTSPPASSNIRRVSGCCFAKPDVASRSLLIQLRRELDCFAGVFTAQLAKVPAAQEQGQRRSQREDADEKCCLPRESRGIDVEKKYRQPADQRVNHRQAFINGS